MPKREKLSRIDERIPINVTVDTGDTAMGLGPATCSVSSTNAQTTLSHTHEITTSSDVGVQAVIMATSASGDFTMDGILAAGQITTSIGYAANLSADALVVGTISHSSAWVAVEDGLNVTGTVDYSGSLRKRAAGGTYSLAPMCYLTTPLTTASWDGDIKSSADNGTIDLSSVFGAPAGIKAALVKVVLDAGSVDDIVGIGPTMAAQTALEMHYQHAGYQEPHLAVVPCNASGDLCFATLSGSIGITLEIWGYAI